MSGAIKIITSESWATQAAKLSVLIPFYKDDPLPALRALEQQNFAPNQVEFLIHDDGTSDSAIDAVLKDFLAATKLAVHATLGSKNAGRSAARNTLEHAARGDWVLFLDADMEPVHADFLQTYLAEIDKNQADVIFGGFQVQRQQSDPNRELHRALSEQSDCLPLDERAARGAQFVASSNLCVRRAVLRAEPFDAEFQGWGWEDSEWAARISQKFRLCHIDNPALHLGLETTETLLNRFQTSGSNYARFTQKHPDLAQSLALYAMSKKLGKFPGQRAARPFLKAVVKWRGAPVRLRLIALKLWRASWYADALS